MCLRVPAAGRCFGFCTGGQERSDGWLRSFPLSNVRHTVDRLDSIWALVLKTHLFPVYVSPTGGVSDLLGDDVSCDLTWQLWKG